MSVRHERAGRRDGTFDAFELSARRASVDGSIDATMLPRVIEALAAEQGREAGVGVITWRITGTQDALGRPALEVGLEGAVSLECQRCLVPFAWPVAQRTLLLLAKDERELARLDENDEHEVVLASAPLDPLTLVEDELLLTLPFAPRCERPECANATAPGAAAKAGEPPGAAAGAFGALAGWKPAPKPRK